MSRIYFVKPVGMDGPVKIGITKNVEKRLMALSVWSPFPLEIIVWVPGTLEDEKLLHSTFADSHSHREWFAVTPELTDAIEKIKRGTPIVEAINPPAEQRSIRKRRVAPVSAERLLWRQYGKKLRHTARHAQEAAKAESGKAVEFRYIPDDAEEIMRLWRRDDHIAPAALARLDEVIADPVAHCVEMEQKHWHEKYEMILRRNLARQGEESAQ